MRAKTVHTTNPKPQKYNSESWNSEGNFPKREKSRNHFQIHAHTKICKPSTYFFNLSEVSLGLNLNFNSPMCI